MTPRPSQLQLKTSFATHVQVQANPKFTTKDPMNLSMEDIMVDFKVIEPDEHCPDWSVSLKVAFGGSEKINSPYAFFVELIGYYAVLGKVTKKQAKWLVETNGPSVLYSSAREILRAAMATGPYKSIVLPTVSFYTEEAKKAVARLPGK